MMKRKCRAIYATDDAREKRIYAACDLLGIEDENITADEVGNGDVIIFVTCTQRQWKGLKHELKLAKYWI